MRFREFVLLGILILALAAPAVAQQDSNSSTTTGPSVSVTLVPFVGISGATYDFGVVVNQIQTGNFQSGSQVTSTIALEDRLSVQQGSRPMFIFAAETGGRKNGLGFGGSGWAYSSTGTTQGVLGKNDLLYMMDIYSRGDRQDYTAMNRWDIRTVDGGLILYNNRPRVATKLFIGGAFASINERTEVSVSSIFDESFFNPYDGTQNFYHNDSAMESSSKVDFSGFGPTVGFMASVKLGKRVTLNNSTKGALIIGERNESGEYEFKNNSYSTGDGYYGSSNDDFSSPYQAVAKATVLMLQEGLSLKVQLGDFQIGGGFFAALFHGATATPQNGTTWSRGEKTGLALAGGTVSASYGW